MGSPETERKVEPAASVVTDDNDVTVQSRASKAGDYCKRSLKFLFSHIGLCGMVVAYCVAGGFIFEHLEKTNEKQECMGSMEKYLPMENQTMFKLWDVAKNFGGEVDSLLQDSTEVEIIALSEIQQVLEMFRNDVLDVGYNGDNCTMMGEPGGPHFKWNFPGALLFSVTVITTIGYGNIAPKTFWGRLVCIAYATLGIPLMLLCLANIGDVMADIFKYIYSNICCCGCCHRKERRVPNTSIDENSPEAWKAKMENDKAGAMVVDDDEEEEEDEKISVPLTITMGVIAGYIFLGAMLFGFWEQWTPLDASYFCFVTVSTIGFGDLVPGSASFEDTSDQYKMVLAAIYMLFGLALLSMCFSLIQEEIATKFKWVGEKLGIVEKEQDEEDEEDEEGEGEDADSQVASRDRDQ